LAGNSPITGACRFLALAFDVPLAGPSQASGGNCQSGGQC
jgi:hypothetical protein